MSFSISKTAMMSALAAGALVIGAEKAAAAPQILAVVAWEGGAKVICHDGTCHTDLSSFCLQQDRPVPASGTAYHPAGDHFELKVTTTEGLTKTIPLENKPEDALTFQSQRGFTSVRVTIDPSILPKNVKTAHLMVANDASLIPVPKAGEPNPLTPQEIEYVTSSLRAIGSDTVDRTDRAAAAQVLNQAVATIVSPTDRATPAKLDRLWNDVIDDLGPALKHKPDALHRARQAYERCTDGAAHHSMAGVRMCLEYRHGDLMTPLNSEYWEKTKPGS